MNLQSRTITDPKVSEALTESTQRIRAMSMVHEKLYAGSDLAHIDFVSYLSSLALSQVVFYRIDPRKVTLETTKETIMLDINTAIPLGLVMNEPGIKRTQTCIPRQPEGNDPDRYTGNKRPA